jgi:acyl carrier protein
MGIEELFASVLDVPAATLTEHSSPATIKNWNSLGHLRLIAAMEDVYGITFSSGEIRTIKSLGGARALLQAKGALVTAEYVR